LTAVSHVAASSEVKRGLPEKARRYGFDASGALGRALGVRRKEVEWVLRSDVIRELELDAEAEDLTGRFEGARRGEEVALNGAGGTSRARRAGYRARVRERAGDPLGSSPGNRASA